MLVSVFVRQNCGMCIAQSILNTRVAPFFGPWQHAQFRIVVVLGISVWSQVALTVVFRLGFGVGFKVWFKVVFSARSGRHILNSARRFIILTYLCRAALNPNPATN